MSSSVRVVCDKELQRDRAERELFSQAYMASYHDGQKYSAEARAGRASDAAGYAVNHMRTYFRDTGE